MVIKFQCLIAFLEQLIDIEISLGCLLKDRYLNWNLNLFVYYALNYRWNFKRHLSSSWYCDLLYILRCQGTTRCASIIRYKHCLIPSIQTTVWEMSCCHLKYLNAMHKMFCNLKIKLMMFQMSDCSLIYLLLR